MRVALVTCRKVPALTDDDRLLQPALESHGAAAEAVAWDDPGVDWSRFDRVVLRSVWDYHLRPREFDAWLTGRERDGATTWNPPALVRWNAHKAYLRTLAERGIATLDTEWIARGSAASLGAVMDARGWSDVVAKPAVSASAYRTFRVAREEAAARQPGLDAILADGDALVQPFAPEIADGEWS